MELNEKPKFLNRSGLIFIDITSEAYREYEWGDGIKVRIDFPVYLNVSKSGSHRVFDNDGVSHYIPSGWRHLHWKADLNEPNFIL